MTNYKLLLSITFTHLFSRVKQSSIAALGVTFGIGTFIVLMSFMTGLNDLLDGLMLNRTPHVHIYNEVKPTSVQPIQEDFSFKNVFNVVESIKPKSSSEKIHNAKQLIPILRDRSGVKGICSRVSVKGYYLAGTNDLNGVINGIEVNEEMRLFHFEDYVIKGDAIDLLKHKNSIMIGSGIAEKLALKLYDKIQVKTVQEEVFTLKIIGIYKRGISEVDNIQSYVSLGTAQRFLGKNSDYISDINIKLNDIEKAPGFSRFIERTYQVSAIDIMSSNAQFDTGSSIRTLISYAVSITLLIVAGFGIYNILNMLIYEKMNDIAILKAVGFSGADVQKIFIFQALIIGVLGGFLGLLFGYLVSLLISHTPFETDALPTVSTYPINFDLRFYLIGFVFAMVSTFLAGYLPSLRARKIDAVEIIRGQ